MAEGLRPSILVVDDDAGIREVLRFLFEDAGYDVEEAGDGIAALTLLKREPRPRVMFLDRMMPRLDGVQTLSLISNEPELLERTIVLFMTARSDPPEREIAELIQRSTSSTFSKPFDLDELLKAVESARKQLRERASSVPPDLALAV
jgi:CheY-like chemotaxis protein